MFVVDKQDNKLNLGHIMEHSEKSLFFNVQCDIQGMQKIQQPKLNCKYGKRGMKNMYLVKLPRFFVISSPLNPVCILQLWRGEAHSEVYFGASEGRGIL